MGDCHVGLQARLMSQALRKLAGTLNRTDTICLFTNQLREKIGVMFGNPETTPGRPRAEVLLVGPPRHPPHRDAEGRRRGVRQPRPRQGREEQGRAAVQAGRVRHHLRHRHLLGGHGARRRHRAQGRHEVGLVLQLRRRAARPGPPERDRVPARASRRDAADPPADPGRARAGPGRLGAAAAAARQRSDGAKARREGCSGVRSPRSARRRGVAVVTALTRGGAAASRSSSTARRGGAARRRGRAAGLRRPRARPRDGADARRELRRAERSARAAGARARDRSRRRSRSGSTGRGRRPRARDALGTLERAGSSTTPASRAARARRSPTRGFGDAAIRFDLERRGLAAESSRQALAGLEPERGAGRPARRATRARPRKTARWLARKGFDEAALEEALGGFADEA